MFAELYTLRVDAVAVLFPRRGELVGASVPQQAQAFVEGVYRCTKVAIVHGANRLHCRKELPLQDEIVDLRPGVHDGIMADR